MEIHCKYAVYVMSCTYLPQKVLLQALFPLDSFASIPAMNEVCVSSHWNKLLDIHLRLVMKLYPNNTVGMHIGVAVCYEKRMFHNMEDISMQ